MDQPRDTISFQYIECDIEPGLTLDEYRRSRPSEPSIWKQLKRRMRGLSATA